MLWIILFTVIVLILFVRKQKWIGKYKIISDLTLLRLELDRLQKNGNFDEKSFDSARKKIDYAITRIFIEEDGLQPGTGLWLKRRNDAWQNLASSLNLDPREAPWRPKRTEERQNESAATVQTAPITPPPPAKSAPVSKPVPPPLPVHAEKAVVNVQTETVLSVKTQTVPTDSVKQTEVSQTAQEVASAPVKQKVALPLSVPASPEKPILQQNQVKISAPASPKTIQKEKPRDTSRFAWEAQKPGQLELLMQKVTGWSRLLIPFLIQNIGWFVSCFSFVSGSVFLISYSEGFLRLLLICLCLLAYTLLTLFGAWHIRRKKPELRTAANVLTTLGMLLIPLSIASGIRLANVHLPAGAGLTLISFGIFWYCAQLASGTMDRSLQGLHPRLFMMMTAVQMAVPIIIRFPFWYMMALFHLLLLLLLGYSLIRFSKDWFRSIFLDQEKIAYYAAGTLVYAAAVSFIHVTWSYPSSVSAAYYAPFLMLLSALLFYTDAECKQWVKEYTFLSRFTIAVYAISVTAILLSLGNHFSRITTLSMGLAVYGTVIWRYLTITPFWLLTGCFSALYALLILQHIPAQTHFLASLPGLAGLLGIQIWAIKRNARSLALTVFRIRGGLGTGLAIWSLANTSPGFTGFATCLFLTVFIYISLRHAPEYLLNSVKFFQKGMPENKRDLRDTKLFYAVLFCSIMTVVYAPVWPGILWQTQFAASLILLSAAWSELALGMFRRQNENISPRVPMMLNASLLSVFSAIALMHHFMPRSEQILFLIPVMAIDSVILFRQSLIFRDRFLFSLALVMGGASGAFIKHTFFPGFSVGIASMLISMTLWIITWYLERMHRIRAMLTTDNPQETKPLFTLLGIHEIRPLTIHQAFGLPLTCAMIFLWGLGLFKAGLYLLHTGPDFAWIVSASLASVLTVLLMARFRMLYFFSIPVLMGLGIFLTVMKPFISWEIPSISLAVSSYALAIWLIVRQCLDSAKLFRIAEILLLTGGHNGGGREQIGFMTHKTGYLLIFCSTAVAVLFWIDQTGISVLPVLAVSIIFTFLSGRLYSKPAYTYDVLALIFITVLMLHAEFLQIKNTGLLLTDQRTGMLMTFAGLGIMAFGRWLKKRDSENVPETVSDARIRPFFHFSTLLLFSAGSQELLLTVSGMKINFMLIAGLLIAGCGLLALHHCRKEYWPNISGLALICLSLLCLQIFVFHPGGAFDFWPSQGDRWISIAIMSMTLAFVSVSAGISKYIPVYQSSFRQTAWISYLWTACKAVPLFADVFTEIPASAFIPCFFAVMGFTFFPLTKNVFHAPNWRGIVLLFLATGIFFSTVPLSGLPVGMNAAVPIWAWTLLISGTILLPYWNGKFPVWSVESVFWPWAGLMLAVLYLPVTKGIFTAMLNLSYWIGLSVFFFLMLRNQSDAILVWLSVICMSFAAFTFLHQMIPNTADLYLLMMGCLAWGNILLAMIPLWPHCRSLLIWLGWKDFDLIPPLRTVPSLIFALALMLSVYLNTLIPLVRNTSVSETYLLLTTVLLCLSFMHLYLRNRSNPAAQGIFLSLFCLVLGFKIEFSALPSLSLILTIWSALLTAAGILWHNRQKKMETESVPVSSSPLFSALSDWMSLSPFIALTTLLFLPIGSFAEAVLTIALLSILMAILGEFRHHAFMKKMSRLLGLLLLHMWPLAFLPAKKGAAFTIWQLWPILMAQFQRLQVLFPWYALELALLAWAILALRNFAAGQAGEKYPFLRRIKLRFHFIATLSLCEWGLHLYLFAHQTFSGNVQYAWIQASAFLTAGILLMALGLRQMKLFPASAWVYALSAIAGLTGFYLRLIILGPVSLCIWDSALILFAAWILAIWSRFTESEIFSAPMQRISTMLSIGLLFTFPWQTGSVHASSILMLTGLLYFSQYHATEKSLFLYIGSVLINAALYLWIPLWSQKSNLLQIYAIPASLTVLAILHLHRKELRRSVLNASRLTAVCVLYAAVSLDLFLRPELSVFILALGLSLAGIIAGIAMRVRAFLYGGVVFMVMNVTSQMFRFYPEQGLGKGIVLVAMGAFIMSAMIWFSLRREEILKRFRIIRADLEVWE
ncbi:MAG: hypothetical protein AB7S75_00845 [Desulfococcaceae bacterium]